MRQIALDTETTGIGHDQGHRIIEIGCVELLNRRYESKSTIVTTNKQFAQWNEVFPNAACVVSLVDRGGSGCLDRPPGFVKWIPAVDYAADSSGCELEYTVFGVRPSSA